MAANGSLAVDGGEPERVYMNQLGQFPARATWSSTSTDVTYSVALGDYDGDGDLDLATGNGRIDLNSGEPVGEPNQIYRNDLGVLTTNPVWTSPELDATLHIAWVDMDSDGDADLVAGNDGQSHFYRNSGVAGDGTPQLMVAWSSTQPRRTYEIMGADVTNDGMLDLTLINGSDIGQAPQIYRNQGTALTAGQSTWGSLDDLEPPALAWGDMNGDGYLDLAASYHQAQAGALAIYPNQQGMLGQLPEALSVAPNAVTTLAWGDVDGDYDLDLAAVVTSQSLRLYRNHLGKFDPTPMWQPNEPDIPVAIAWGDYDGDGDLDLVVSSEALRIYRNDGGMLTLSAVWTAPKSWGAIGLAWGDLDNDGDLDLVVGNMDNTDRGVVDSTIQLYRNDGVDGTTQAPIFTVSWSAEEFNPTVADNVTTHLALGDYDGDGDLDLVVGDQSRPTRLYRNDNGQLTSRAIWQSQDHDATVQLAWGDYDNDGDLDLIVASGGMTALALIPATKQNRLYRNENGQLSDWATWMSPNLASTWSIDWGDVDNDGDLDLAMGYYKQTNLLLKNSLHINMAGVNSPTRIAIRRPGFTANAGGYSSAEVLTDQTIAIRYTLYDAEGDSVPRIFPEFSPTGGGQWFPATEAVGGDGVSNLSASPQGVEHTFLWHVAENMTKSDNVVFRLRAQPGYTHSPIYWSAPAAQSPPFRVAPPWYIRVVDEQGNPVSGAVVYADGQPITSAYAQRTTTDRAGLLVPLTPPIGESLVAVWQVATQPTIRQQHDGWAYRTHLTTLNWSSEGVAQATIAGATGEQRLILRQKNPLILFNLVVSVEWAASDAYLQQFANAMQSASNYLHDLTDGQMAFGQVTIYENGAAWENADIQVGAKRGIHPHAYHHGIKSDDPSQVVIVGRGWDKTGDDSKSWTASDGYRTLVHEFAHYALSLYDEYMVFDYDANAQLQNKGIRSAFCTSPLIEAAIEQDATNASAMYWQYTSSELSARGVTGLWSELCESTAQTQHNPVFRALPKTGEGESTWETLASVYADHLSPPRWQIETPIARQTIWSGPEQLSAALPAWPHVTTIHSGTQASSPITLTVYANGTPYTNGAVVTLYQSPLAGNKVLGQGATDGQGRLEIVGASAEDVLRVVSFDGRYSGQVKLSAGSQQVNLDFQPSLELQRAQVDSALPYVRILPELATNATEIQLNFQLYHLNTQSKPLLSVILPDSAMSAPVVNYSPSDSFYSANVAYTASQGGSGQIRVFGQSAANQAVYLASDYRLHVATNTQPQELFAVDGKVQLYLSADSTPGAQTVFVMNPLRATPGPLLPQTQLASEIYDITASGSIVQLEKPGSLNFHYDPHLLPSTVTTDTLDIYRWDVNGAQWVAQAAVFDRERHMLSTKIQMLGIYALFYQEQATLPTAYPIYLPLIKR